MLINDELTKQRITKYKLSKESGVPQATTNDICRGKTDVEKCAAGTLYRLAKVLGISVEAILESKETRSSFETFKSNICHRVKDMGDLDFILELLENDQIRSLYRRHWYVEAYYLLGMIDYLYNQNDLPIFTRYNELRAGKLERPILPTGVVLTSEVCKTDEPIREAMDNAIPEFLRYNIVESEVRNVV